MLVKEARLHTGSLGKTSKMPGQIPWHFSTQVEGRDEACQGQGNSM